MHLSALTNTVAKQKERLANLLNYTEVKYEITLPISFHKHAHKFRLDKYSCFFKAIFYLYFLTGE